MIQLQRRLFEDLHHGGRDAVQVSLQQAIDLEHATIPAYLYALYSLDAAKNAAIARILRSVVVEEMLHMTLACNLLNALAGDPVIDEPGFLPTYPGPLPGSVDAGLIVSLAPFSLANVRDVFMAIEEPEHALEFPTDALVAPPPSLTIGAFYRSILAEIEKLGDAAFTGPRRLQIGPEAMPDAVIVTDVASARRAIETIVEQGEGTSMSPLEVVGRDYAHYYRFAEVFHGRGLVPNPDAGPSTPPEQRYRYEGPPIPFDPTGVYAAPTSPKSATYPAGSVARRLCETFNYTYTSLLRSLHDVFNGEPHRLGAAIGLMMSLEQQAKGMMSGASASGQSIGPSFEYQPTNG